MAGEHYGHKFVVFYNLSPFINFLLGKVDKYCKKLQKNLQISTTLIILELSCDTKQKLTPFWTKFCLDQNKFHDCHDSPDGPFMAFFFNLWLLGMGPLWSYFLMYAFWGTFFTLNLCWVTKRHFFSSS